MPGPRPGLLDLLSACYENLCKPERGTRFSLLSCQFKCEIVAKVLKVWTWVKNRGPRTANSLMGNYWSLKQHNLKSCEKTAFTEGKESAAQWGTKKSQPKNRRKHMPQPGNPPPVFGQQVVNSWSPRARRCLEVQMLYNRMRSQVW